ncbi:MAG: AbrB/MazE/SpoVT family DNA-binding domain-containing protein [Chloroflexi bacterium]|nr:AbrB/MazE/SpoVT family DNA-binding domain-containing protein [Chloroflexota bacterium]
MVKRSRNTFCCGPGAGCRIESLVTVDERGQMVLPKDVRDKAGVQPGEKLALVTWGRNGEIECLALIKVDKLTEMIKGLLGPMAREILQNKEGTL